MWYLHNQYKTYQYKVPITWTVVHDAGNTIYHKRKFYHIVFYKSIIIHKKEIRLHAILMDH